MRLIFALACLLVSACQEDPGVIVDIDDDGGFTRHDAARDGGADDRDGGNRDRSP
jgi:hypothetical protein